MAFNYDFLFNGQPPKSVTTYGTETTSVPQWVSDMQQGIAAKATGIAGQAYQAYGGPRIAGFNADQNSSFDMTRDAAGSHDADFNGAIGAARAGGAGAHAEAAGQPWLDKSGQATYDTVNNYMNPYTQNVVDRIGDMGARNLNEKLMPAINSDFIRAGQYGSTGQMAEFGKALRDTQGEVIAQQGKALSDGYQSSLDAANNDANRFGQIGQTAAANANMDTDAQLTAASKAGALTTLAQEGQYRDANAMASQGALQQNMTQSNLDLAKTDFDEQNNYQKEQLGWLNNVVKNFEVPTSTSATRTAPLQADQYGGTGLEQTLGAGLASYNLLNGK